jgi:type IX secretion system PorP/SprF family membrane protein
MIKKLYYILFSLLLFCQAGQAQDALFSQLHNSRNLLNPALLALQNNPLEIDLNFREQGGSVSGGLPIRTFQVLANFTHQSFEVDQLSYGISVLNDRGGQGHLGESIVHGHFAYLKKMTGKYSKIGEHYLGIGTSLGGGQKSVDVDNFWFGNQFNEQYNFIEEGKDAKEDILLTGSIARSPIFYDINAGMTWYANFTESFSMNAGVSLFHLNRPNISLIEGQLERQKLRYAMHIGSVNKLSDLLLILPKVQFTRHGKSNLFIVGSEIAMDNGDRNEFAMKFGLFTRTLTNVDNISMDAIIVTLNASYEQFVFGLGYDLTVSKLSRYNNGRGSWEFRLGYAFRGKSDLVGRKKAPSYRM